jgi:hypothetical protein
MHLGCHFLFECNRCLVDVIAPGVPCWQVVLAGCAGFCLLWWSGSQCCMQLCHAAAGTRKLVVRGMLVCGLLHGSCETGCTAAKGCCWAVAHAAWQCKHAHVTEHPACMHGLSSILCELRACCSAPVPCCMLAGCSVYVQLAFFGSCTAGSKGSALPRSHHGSVSPVVCLSVQQVGGVEWNGVLEISGLCVVFHLAPWCYLRQQQCMPIRLHTPAVHSCCCTRMLLHSAPGPPSWAALNA